MARTPSEKETWENLFGWAKRVGCYESLVTLYNRYTGLLKGAKDAQEYKAIQIMAIKELSTFFGQAQITNLQFKDGSVLQLDEKSNVTITRGSRKDKK